MSIRVFQINLIQSHFKANRKMDQTTFVRRTQNAPKPRPPRLKHKHSFKAILVCITLLLQQHVALATVCEKVDPVRLSIEKDLNDQTVTDYSMEVELDPVDCTPNIEITLVDKGGFLGMQGGSVTALTWDSVNQVLNLRLEAVSVFIEPGSYQIEVQLYNRDEDETNKNRIKLKVTDVDNLYVGPPDSFTLASVTDQTVLFNLGTALTFDFPARVYEPPGYAATAIEMSILETTSGTTYESQVGGSATINLAEQVEIPAPAEQVSAGSYTFQLTARIQGYYLEATQTFTLIVEDQDICASFSLEATSPADKTTTNQANTAHGALVFAPVETVTDCPNLVYTFQETSTQVPGFMTQRGEQLFISDANTSGVSPGQLMVPGTEWTDSSTQNIDAGTYTWDVTAQDTSTGHSAKTTFTLNVIDCAPTTNCPGDLSYDFSQQGGYQVNGDSYFTVPNVICGSASYQCTVDFATDGMVDLCSVSNAGISSFDSSTGQVSILTNEPGMLFTSIQQAPVVEMRSDLIIQATAESGQGTNQCIVSLVLVNTCQDQSLTLVNSDSAMPNQQQELEQVHSPTPFVWTEIVNIVDAPASAQTNCGDLKISLFVSKTGDSSFLALGSSPYASYFTVDQDNRLVTVAQTSDTSRLGLYTFQYQVYAQSYPWMTTAQSSGTVSFEIEIIRPPCSSANSVTKSVSSDSISMQSYFIAESSQTLTVDEFTVDPANCDINYSYTASQSTSVVSFDPATRTFTFFHDSDMDVAPTTSPFYSDVTVTITGTSHAQSDSATFTLRVQNPCQDQSLTLVNSSTAMPDQQYELGAVHSPDPFVWTDVVNLVNEPASVSCGSLGVSLFVSKAGDSSFVALASSPYASYFTVDQDNRLVTVAQTSDTSRLGVYTFQYQVYAESYPWMTTAQSSGSTTFEIEIIRPPCSSASSVTKSVSSASISMQTYWISNSAQYLTIDEFTVDPPNCDITYSYTVSQTTSVVSFDPATRTFTFFHDSDMDVAPTASPFYSDVTVTMVGTSHAQSDSATFTLRVQNPCQNQSLTLVSNDSAMPDQQYELGEVHSPSPFVWTEVVNIVDAPASASINCGLLSMDLFVSKTGDSSFLALASSPYASYFTVDQDNRLVTVAQTSDTSRLGLYTFQYQVYAQSYPWMTTAQSSGSTTFEIEIIRPPCSSASSVTKSVSSDSISMQSYYIMDSQQTLTIDEFTVDPPNCDITYSYAVSQSTSVVSFDPVTRTFTFFHDSDFYIAPTTSPYYVDVTITVTGTSPNESDSAEFTLRIQNPCPSSLKNTISDGGVTIGPLTYIITDAASYFDFAFTQLVSACPTLTYSMSYQQLDPNTNLWSSASTNVVTYDAAAGRGTMVRSGDLDLAPTTSPYQVELKLTLSGSNGNNAASTEIPITLVNPCRDPQLVDYSASVSSQAYTIGKSATTYTVPAFTAVKGPFSPAGAYDPAPVCHILSYSIASKTPLPTAASMFSLDSSSRTLTVSHTADLDIVSTTAPFTTDVTLGIRGTHGDLDKDIPLVVTLTNPCGLPSEVTYTAPNLTPVDFTIADPDETVDLAFRDTLNGFCQTQDFVISHSLSQSTQTTSFSQPLPSSNAKRLTFGWSQDLDVAPTVAPWNTAVVITVDGQYSDGVTTKTSTDLHLNIWNPCACGSTGADLDGNQSCADTNTGSYTSITLTVTQLVEHTNRLGPTNLFDSQADFSLTLQSPKVDSVPHSDVTFCGTFTVVPSQEQDPLKWVISTGTSTTKFEYTVPPAKTRPQITNSVCPGVDLSSYDLTKYLSYQCLDFEVALETYPHIKETTDVQVLTLPCPVDETDIELPYYDAQIVDLTTPEQLVIQFNPFESASLSACSFDWTYTLGIDPLQYLPHVTFSENRANILITKSDAMSAREGTLYLYGSALTDTGVEVVREVAIGLTFVEDIEEVDKDEGAVEAVVKLINWPPAFVEDLDSVYEVDLADYSTPTFSINLGKITDYEGDTFEVTVTQSKNPNFIQVEQFGGDWQITLDLVAAMNGNYVFRFNIKETIEGRIRREYIEVIVSVVDTRPPPVVSTKVVAPTSTFTPPVSVEATAIQKEIAAVNSKIKKPAIAFLTNYGSLRLKYTEERFVEMEFESTRRRRMQEQPVQSKGFEIVRVQGGLKEGSMTVSGVDVFIEVSETSDKDLLSFEYAVDSFDDEELNLALYFENPTEVSASIDRDLLVVELTDFRDTSGKLIYDQIVLKKSLPNQISAEAALVAQAIGETASYVVGATATINVILKFIMGGSLNQMLSSIKNLQVIVHLGLLKVNQPAITKGFFAAIFDMISFDPISIEDELRSLFDLYDVDEVDASIVEDSEGAVVDQSSEVFSDLGYESSFLLVNMGSLALILCFQLALLPIYVLVYLLAFLPRRLRDFVSQKLGGFFFNGILTFIDGTFILLILMAVIDLKREYDGVIQKNSSYWTAVIALMVCLLEVVVVSAFLRWQWKAKKLDSEKSLARCGYIYEDLNYRIRGGATLVYPVLYQVRFLVMTAIIFAWGGILVIQVLIVCLSTIALMALIGIVHPFGVLRRNTAELWSEMVTLAVMDLMLVASKGTLSGDSLMLIGIGIMAIMSLSIIISQGSLMWNAISEIIRKCKLKTIRKRIIKNMVERKAKMHARKSSCSSESIRQIFPNNSIELEITASRISRRQKLKEAVKNHYEPQVQARSIQDYQQEQLERASPDKKYKDQTLNSQEILKLAVPEEWNGYTPSDQAQKLNDPFGVYAEPTSKEPQTVPPQKIQAALETDCFGCKQAGQKCILCKLDAAQTAEKTNLDLLVISEENEDAFELV